jgi:gamma-glutamylcyclotransferase (GGCT)/AIG2-like uncharacterized protein YtfP
MRASRCPHMTAGANDGGADLLFVYGTLRRGSDHPMALRLAKCATWVSAGTINGRLYRAGEYPGLVLDPGGSLVAGDLFRLHDPAAMLAQIDTYEEAGPDFPAPQEYIRNALPIVTPTGTVTAWVYCYNWPVVRLPIWSEPISPLPAPAPPPACSSHGRDSRVRCGHKQSAPSAR